LPFLEPSTKFGPDMESIGFIGAGNMGFALAKGLARRFPGMSIHVADRNPQRIELFRRELGRVQAHATASGVAEAAGTVFLAVKSQDYAGLLAELGGTDALVISIAAGVTIARLEQALPRARVVRVMPNTPGLVGEMAAGYACGRRVSAADRRTVLELLQAAGRAVEVEEMLLDAVTGVSGSGPAHAWVCRGRPPASSPCRLFAARRCCCRKPGWNRKPWWPWSARRTGPPLPAARSSKDRM
jgi:pyrroline-5-carboxylate reductase